MFRSGADPASKLRGGRFQYYFLVKYHNGVATVGEMKSTSQHSCDKKVDNKTAL